MYQLQNFNRSIRAARVSKRPQKHLTRSLTVAARISGFTLLEMLIVLVIISILTAIAYPSYTHYRIKTHRADGQTALHILSAQMERYFAEHNTYTGATFKKLGIESKSERGLYQLKITINDNGNGYKLTAAPLDSQTADQECGILGLDQKGKKSVTGTGKIQGCL